MTKTPPDHPRMPTHADKFKARENALRDNLLKRKQQQRARATTPPPSSDTEGK